MNKTSIIIGAGQTGRGFIAPFLQKAGHEIIFIDRSKELITRMEKEGKYTVQYCGGERKEEVIKNFQCCLVQDGQVVTKLQEADYIFVAVGESNLPSLIPLLEQAFGDRTSAGEKPLLMTCENGTSPKHFFVEAGLDKKLQMTEGIVFCTTLSPDDSSLDLLSEVYPVIPYDDEAIERQVEIDGFQPTKKFHTLIERKIFTYNCLSAVISYVGTFYHYENYAEAANDILINKMMEELSGELNEALAEYYGIPLEDQREFCNLAMKKFKNKDIIDTVERNARDVRRKLGPEERMVKPLRILNHFSKDTTILEIVIAAAIDYGKQQNELMESAETVVSAICGLEDCVSVKTRILNYYHLLVQGTEIKDLIGSQNPEPAV
ncbi:MAG: 2-dehydropantoate 2-reductase N-terminal domain-containing protein [Bacillus sp. (in: firmicutes)]